MGDGADAMEKEVLDALWEAHDACPPDGVCVVDDCEGCLKCSIAEMCFHIEYPELFPHTAGGDNEGHEHKEMVMGPLRFALERCRAYFVKQRDHWKEDVPGQRAASYAENMEIWVKGIDAALEMASRWESADTAARERSQSLIEWVREGDGDGLP